MANVLKMALIESILSLHAKGWSQRRIARQLEIDRETVGKYLRQQLSEAKPANLPTGSVGSKPATFSGLPGRDSKPASNLPTGSQELGGRESAGNSRPSDAIRPAGPRSSCEPYRELIQGKVAAELSAKRIWQELQAEGIAIGYDSVRRFVQRLGRVRAVPFRRMECGPGEEAQVDFGVGAPVITPQGKRRRTYVFRIVLSHSRKGYSEATFTQTTEDFFRCLENAFAHFGGVPQTLVIDNLKAAVAHPDWFDPILTPKVQAFCQHYGTVILPTKPYMPRHKGKVESGVKYVKNNGLKARKFSSLEEENRFLAEWEASVADKRIHGTTKQQVQKLFAVEQPTLRKMPLERFACFHEARRKVSRDGHVEVARAYYSAPPEYLGREVWVRWDARLVRIFNHRFEPLAVHVRHEQGRFSTNPQHIVPEKISGLEKGVTYLLRKVSLVGPFTQQWSEAMLHARGIQGTRVLQGLLSLTKKHSSEKLEKACKTALSYHSWRLKTIRHLATRGGGEKQEPLPFLDEHPIIRPLADYGAVVAQAFHRQADRSSLSEGLERHSWTKTNEKSLRAFSARAGSADLSSSRPDYPSTGYTSAEPASVSSDSSTVVPLDPMSTPENTNE